jgi:sugar/nucleoside kinase (ribokinase family)
VTASPPADGRDAGPDLVLVIGAFTIDDIVLPDGTTHMGTLGGNCVHCATAVVAGGASAAVVARRGEDFPTTALDALAGAGIDTSAIADITGPTQRNWVVYEWDGRRTWIDRTPVERLGAVCPLPEDLDESRLAPASVIHVTALPLENSEALVARIRELTATAIVTLDTHEDWLADTRDRVLRLAAQVDIFVPSLEELLELTGASGPVEALHDVAAAGLRRVVLKAGADGVYILDDARLTHVPASDVAVADTTGAGDAFCGGLCAGLARGWRLVDAVGLGAAVAGTAITGVGSLRLLEIAPDPQSIDAAGRRLADAVHEVAKRA